MGSSLFNYTSARRALQLLRLPACLLRIVWSRQRVSAPQCTPQTLGTSHQSKLFLCCARVPQGQVGRD
jgi:hypothetical protein